MEARNIEVSAYYLLTANSDSISLSACQQLCIDTEECKAIGRMSHLGLCSMYSQYTSGNISIAETHKVLLTDIL